MSYGEGVAVSRHSPGVPLSSHVSYACITLLHFNHETWSEQHQLCNPRPTPSSLTVQHRAARGSP